MLEYFKISNKWFQFYYDTDIVLFFYFVLIAKIGELKNDSNSSQISNLSNSSNSSD